MQSQTPIVAHRSTMPHDHHMDSLLTCGYKTIAVTVGSDGVSQAAMMAHKAPPSHENPQRHGEPPPPPFHLLWPQLVRFVQQFGHTQVPNDAKHEQLHKWVNHDIVLASTNGTILPYQFYMLQDIGVKTLQAPLELKEAKFSVGRPSLQKEAPRLKSEMDFILKSATSWHEFAHRWNQVLPFSSRRSLSTLPPSAQSPAGAPPPQAPPAPPPPPPPQTVPTASPSWEESVQTANSAATPTSSSTETTLTTNATMPSSSSHTSTSRREHVWMERLNLLKDFQKKHGHVHVSPNENVKLYRWIRSQKMRYKCNLDPSCKGRPLTSWEYECLVGLGIRLSKPDEPEVSGEEVPVFAASLSSDDDGHDQNDLAPNMGDFWQKSLQELKDYKKEHGHLHVSPKDNPKLYRWIRTQKQRYKCNLDPNIKGRPLTSWEYERLVHVGVRLSSKDEEKKPAEFVAPVFEIQTSSGTCTAERREPVHDKMNVLFGAVAQHVAQQQQEQRQDVQESAQGPATHRHVTPPHTTLRTIVSNDEEEDASTWTNRYQELQQIHMQKGHVRLPANDRSFDGLKKWIRLQRLRHRAMKNPLAVANANVKPLSPEECEKLTQLGVVGRCLVVAPSSQQAAPQESISHSQEDEPLWETQFEKLEAFHMLYGHVEIPASEANFTQLRSWLEKQRQALQHQGQGAVLTKYQIEKLTALGVTAESRKRQMQDESGSQQPNKKPYVPSCYQVTTPWGDQWESVDARNVRYQSQPKSKYWLMGQRGPHAPPMAGRY